MGNRWKRNLLVLLTMTALLATAIVSMPAKGAEPWSGNIIFESNGKISPADAPVKVNNGQYRLTGDVAGSVTIYASDITFKGDGYGLVGAGAGTGIACFRVNNVIIKDIHLSYYSTGIYLYGSTSNTIKDCEIFDNVNIGISFLHSDGNVIVDCEIYDNVYGIALLYSDENDIKGNDVHHNSLYGINSQISTYNVYKGNEIYANGYRGVYILNCANENFIGNSVMDNIGIGVHLRSSPNCHIKGNEVYDNSNSGMYLYAINYIQIIGNQIHDNIETGLYLYGSSNNLITENEVFDNGYRGINLYLSHYNQIHYNNIMDNGNPQATCYGNYNIWDDGAGTGNYWSDYTGFDTDYDGIGDTNLPHLGLDYYPAMAPF